MYRQGGEQPQNTTIKSNSIWSLANLKKKIIEQLFKEHTEERANSKKWQSVQKH